MSMRMTFYTCELRNLRISVGAAICICDFSICLRPAKKNTPSVINLSMDWDNEVVLEFIGLLRGEPIIWNPKKKLRKNRTAMNDAWMRIKNVFSVPCTIDELKRKRNSLMTAYREHLRKIKETTDSGLSADDIYKPTWFAFEPMNSFLGAVYKNHHTINTEQHRDLNIKRSLSRDSDNSSLNENFQSDDSLPICSKRRRGRQDLLLAKNLVKERSSVNVKVTDETDIYAQLLAQKLKRLDEEDRLILMNEIDNLTFNYIMKARSKTTNPTTPIKSIDSKKVSDGSVIKKLSS